MIPLHSTPPTIESHLATEAPGRGSVKGSKVNARAAAIAKQKKGEETSAAKLALEKRHETFARSRGWTDQAKHELGLKTWQDVNEFEHRERSNVNRIQFRKHLREQTNPKPAKRPAQQALTARRSTPRSVQNKPAASPNKVAPIASASMTSRKLKTRTSSQGGLRMGKIEGYAV